jgi:hypothetical protein
MFYHLDTIPVWDAVKQDTGCPLCYLREQNERLDVERFLGGSVMEPDVRVKVNEKGFCPRHQQMLYEQKNRLGHALLMQSRLTQVRGETLPLLENALNDMKGGRLLKGDKSGALAAAARAIAEKTSGCVICDSVAEHTERYARTLLHLYKTDESFRDAFGASHGVCMKDLPTLLTLADETLRGDQLKALVRTLYEMEKRELEQAQSDLDGFCVKFDYRNHDKPWGTSRGALERTVNRLRGKTLKEET